MSDTMSVRLESQVERSQRIIDQRICSALTHDHIRSEVFNSFFAGPSKQMDND